MIISNKSYEQIIDQNVFLKENLLMSTEEKPIISIIVPIYNVSLYIRKCLDSLKNQSMRQIEIIMIDDGSTDDSGRIADEYVSNIYPIFRIIHTENRGLSAARNLGIDEAKGQWLMLVDSDDWVDQRYCEIPYKAASEYGADMVVFDYCKSIDISKALAKDISILQHDEIISHEKAYDIGETIPTNKLYKKDLFDNIRFPEGHVFEDYAIMHQLVYKAKKTVLVHNKLYFYRIRKGGICDTIANDKDRLEMSKKRYNELVELGYTKEKAWAQLIETSLKCYGRAAKDVSKEADEILSLVKELPYGLSKKTSVKIRLWRINKHIYRLIYRFIVNVKKYRRLDILKDQVKKELMFR